MSHHIDQSRLYTGYDSDQLPFREKYSIMDRTTKNNMDYLRRIDEASVDNWGERVFKYHDESPLNAFLFPNDIIGDEERKTGPLLISCGVYIVWTRTVYEKTILVNSKSICQT